MIDIVFSIVIPVFNRAWSIRRAVESAISFCAGRIDMEIVLVDDGSDDNTVEIVDNLIAQKSGLSSVSFKFIRHAHNKGVCAAKNTGAQAASGEWLVFLDSDDQLVENAWSEVYEALQVNSMHPLHFFKCVEEDEPIAPAPNCFALMDLNVFLMKGTGGEALPVIRNAVFRKYLYDEDMPGYESLCYLRMVKAHSVAVVNTLVARRYYTSHEDRLSSPKGLRRRYRDLARGHLRVIEEHRCQLTVPALLKQYLRYVKSLMGLAHIIR